MKKIFILLFIVLSCKVEKATNEIHLTTTFEKSNGTETATYSEIIDFYKNLAKLSPAINVHIGGETDSGEKLHLVVLNSKSETDFNKLRKDHLMVLINNGIHPGESDGIDATMMLFRDIVQGKIKIPKNVILTTIPVYNIGGALNRNSTTRVNQNGPKEYGFRGNGRNYDLNRDFIKNDTKNAKAFTEIFHWIKPDVFIDNHVSNGADYQYTLTHLFTQHNKLGGNLSTYLHEELMPRLEDSLSLKKWDITPYVNVFNQVPENGFSQFMDNPRYSTGYTTLWNTLGMMVETHMLKPYKQRVKGTYELMKEVISITGQDYKKIKELRSKAFKMFRNSSTYTLQWVQDESKTSLLNFKGYEGKMIESKVTGMQRLKYDQNKPFTKETVYKNYYKPSKKIKIPKAYLIPKSWHNIIDLLVLNQVKIEELDKTQKLKVETYHINSYDTYEHVYEGHYPHYNVDVKQSIDSILIKKDNYFLVKTNQESIRYIIETLEIEAPDSFFNWNFFDTILQQKESFSPYVFEDIALEILDNNLILKNEFENKKKNSSNFSSNWQEQLNWIYQQSGYHEKAHLKYPILRVL